MKRLILLIAVFALVWLAACAPATETPTATAVSEPQVEAAEPVLATAAPTATDLPPTVTPAPPAEPTPTEEPVADQSLDEVVEGDGPAPGSLGPVKQEDVVIEAADGLELDATFYAAAGLENAPGVLLLHMLGSNRTIWDTVGLAEALATKGYAVLALDMRGHGETGSSQDWVQAEDDIQRAWQYFADRPEVDAGKTAVLGASIGSNMALIAAANEPTIRTAILLSPGLIYRGVTTEDRLPDYGDRPLLMVASKDDFYSEDSVNKLAETAVGETQVVIYENAGHGTAMFEAEAGLTPTILDWLDQHVSD